MKISSSPTSGLTVDGLPPGLSGVHGTDVVLPTGVYAYLRGASLDAHVHLQNEIELIAGSAPLPPQLLLKCAVDQYYRRLMEAVGNAA